MGEPELAETYRSEDAGRWSYGKGERRGMEEAVEAKGAQ